MESENTPTKVLLINDERQEFLLVGYLLSQAHYDNYRLIWCQDLEEGLEHIEHQYCDVVLLDYHWGTSCKDFIRRSHQLNNRVPIIVMTDDMEREVDRKAISEGASDYLIRDRISPELLERSIRYSMERKKIEYHLDYLAHYDHLTGLPNRMLFHDRLNQTIGLARRTRNQFTLMYLDLNGFKAINDSYGHDVGDKLLQQFSERLLQSVRCSDTVARIGGDEFTILLNNMDSVPKIISLAQKLIENTQRPFSIGQYSLSVGCSIGIATYPEAGANTDILQRHADIAMYQAKQMDTSAYRFFSRIQESSFTLERLSPSNLQGLIKKKKIEIAYTPRIHLASNQIRTLEVTPIFHQKEIDSHNHEELYRFINNNETIRVFTEWIIDHTLSQIMPLQKQHGFTVAFSIHKHQLQSSKFLSYTKSMMKKYQINEKNLELSLLSKKEHYDNSEMEICIDNINAIGAQFSLHRFGESTLSLTSIQRHAISTLHLEPQLFKSTMKIEEDTQLIETLILLAHRLNKTVVVDGVTNQQHKQWLHAINCDEIKGPIIGESLSFNQIKTIFEKQSLYTAVNEKTLKNHLHSTSSNI